LAALVVTLESLAAAICSDLNKLSRLEHQDSHGHHWLRQTSSSGNEGHESLAGEYFLASRCTEHGTQNLLA
jgi:hypothetical protein